MMLKSFVLFAGIAMIASIPQAHAATVTITYEGTVTSSSGSTDMFGGGDLTGKSWVATYVFDTNAGYASGLPSSPTTNFAYGGSYYGNSSPLLSNSLTIGGTYNYTITSTTADWIYGYNCGGSYFSQQDHFAANYSADFDNYLHNIVSNDTGALPATIDAPFIYLIQPEDYQDAYFQLYSKFGPSTAIQARLFKLTETVESVSALIETPLPATFPLFAAGLAGFGLIGWRRRKRKIRL